jgi:hypothetical protein
MLCFLGEPYMTGDYARTQNKTDYAILKTRSKPAEQTQPTAGRSVTRCLTRSVNKGQKMMRLVVGVHVALFVLWCLIVLLFSLEV